MRYQIVAAIAAVLSTPIGFASVSHSAHAHVSQSKKAELDINQASEKELLQLPGLGPKKAAVLFHYREKHGHFKSWNEVLKVPGIGKAKVKKWQSPTVSGLKVVLAG